MSTPTPRKKLVGPNTPSQTEPDTELPQVQPTRPRRIRTWRWIKWTLLAIFTLAVVASVVIGGLIAKSSLAYPNYYPLEYKLVDTYPASTFFDHFTYFSEPDPTHGFIQYQSAEDSIRQNLTIYHSLDSPPPKSINPDTSSNSTSAVLRVDNTHSNTASGRPSARIISKRTYDKGLFLFSILHTPYGCGTWPALWLLGPNWPSGGEIDVVEAVNIGNTGNHVTLHTSEGCRIGPKRKRKQTGTAKTWDCWNEINANSGCGVQGGWDTYGAAFNARGGGIYALEVRKEGIRVWVFKREDVPGDILDGESPDPSRWGTPLADFPNTECDIDRYFSDMQIVVNIALCGDWAGQPHVFGASGRCVGNCVDWVTWRPESFREAYWEFDGFRVYATEY